ncbi:MAG: lysoplasmalogenase [Firmicutes bacterium]|nr:lysoplasmalogenase [Bacillota bacterium]
MQYLYLCGVCLAVMILFIRCEHGKNYTLAVILKGLASAAFVILGFLGKGMCSDPVFAGHVFTGLILGCIADVLLNLRFVFEKKGKIIFLVGILVFLSGHILYLVALMPKCSHLMLCIGIGAVLTVFTMIWLFKRITAAAAFKIFGVFYIGAIMIMTCVAVGILIDSPSAASAVFAAGAVSFLISDIVLILNTFGKESKFSLRIVNLSLYYVGQLLIALSLQLI